MILKRYILPALAFGLAMTSCSDFLDKEPLDQGTDAIMFKNPAQFDQAALALYSFTDWKSADFDGNLDVSGIGSNGGGSAPQSTGNWSGPYSRLRTINILLEKANGYGDKDAIASSIGTAYFFRAWEHFHMMKRFGGVPIVDHVLDTNDPVLFGPRNSRYEVTALVISDLQKAIELLPKRSSLPGLENRGRLTKEAAQSFLARVALYEATWEKYVPTISFNLDGDGTSIGAGSAKPEGYPSVNDMLAIARDMSKAVIQEAESGTFELFNACEELSYYELFNLDDGDGNVSNHMGVGKAANKEFILCNPFDYTLKRSGRNMAHTVVTWQAISV
ncbi:MAG: RagB/SusD family nutrient uptake outer membrane protein, partial [Muribaculaceae bacterium]|nr:RagB/SusD family nutrient uptake outer membrane protein [Muribaculaceae bacterium]